MIKHYSMDSCTGEWLREQIAMETEEATVVLPAITFKRMPELDMTPEQVQQALAEEFNEVKAA